ncbi:MAG: PAS domain-containing protein, partial [Chloroflexi bacterium]|nr:PAS domain-containing protein [Chloroflexota bacterium]
MTGPAEDRRRLEAALAGPDLHRRVLENLGDGVLVIGRGGRIETMNPAAERILELAAGDVLGQTFAEVFFTQEGFDDFTQVLIDATTAEAGAKQQVVAVGERSLSVATTYLRQPGGGRGAAAAIVVFSDITELRELRETELRLARKAEEQHGRLQEAYREIESRNEALAAALRKVRVVQGLGALLAAGFFLGAGYYVWQPLDLFAGAGTTAEATSGPPGEGARWLEVKPKPVSSSISMKGTLAPWRTVAVQSPVDGEVASVRFRVGQEV